MFTGYATVPELAGWLTNAAPVDAPELLRSASFVVAAASGQNPYGGPSDGDTGALRDATCAQAASWIALGINPASQGVGSVAAVKKSSIGSADVERDTAGQLAALQLAASELCPEAEAILTAAGLVDAFAIADGACWP